MLDKKKIKESIKYCLVESIPASIIIGVTDYYFIPLALFLGASTSEIGLLTGIPNLLAAVSLLFAVNIIRLEKSRVSFLAKGTFGQSIILLLIAFLPILHFSWDIKAFIILTVLFRILFNFNGATWGSLVSEYLPFGKRGEYFGSRSQIGGIATIVGVLAAGLILSCFENINPAYGFFIVFAGATLCQLSSSFLMSKLTDIPYKQDKDSEFTFFMFIKRMKESNFVKFVLFIASIIFATHLAAPFFNVYMLRDLELSYSWYTTIQLASVVGGIISFPIWGRHADIVGNAKILKIIGLLIPIIPILWIIYDAPLYLVFINLCSGFLWGGFNLCAANFIYDAVIPIKRIRCLAYFNLINGVALFIGVVFGGYIADILPPIMGYSLITLFIISAILRLLAFLFLEKSFNEVRQVKKISSKELFYSVIGIRPILGRNEEYS